MMLDTPVDYHHESLISFVDRSVLKNYFFTLNGNNLSWKKVIDGYLRKCKKNFSNDLAIEAIHSLDEEYKTDAEQPILPMPDNLESIFQSTVLESTNLISKIGISLHGTHVAGILVKDKLPDEIRLIPVPFEIDFDQLSFPSLSELRSYLDHDADDFDSKVSEISRSIQIEKVVLVNMSMGLPKAKLTRNIRSRVSWWVRAWMPLEINEAVERHLKREVESFERLVTENPQTIFVLASGNEGMDLGGEEGKGGNLLSLMNAPNILFVSALNGIELASFSNYSSRVVDIAAQGCGIESAKMGGGTLHLSGTSMAAPAVSNRIAKIRSMHPELSPAETIETLFAGSVQIPTLDGKVRECRALIKRK